MHGKAFVCQMHSCRKVNYPLKFIVKSLYCCSTFPVNTSQGLQTFVIEAFVSFCVTLHESNFFKAFF
jgi:hypothetical protein